MTNTLSSSSRFIQFWVLVVPVVLCFYAGLYLTIILRYPNGLSPDQLYQHVFNFSIVYVLWLVVFFVHHLFDLEVMRRSRQMVTAIVSSMTVCLLVAVAYFYAQPQLLLTPRRFLLTHVLLTGLILLGWYLLMRTILSRHWIRPVYAYDMEAKIVVEQLVRNYAHLGLAYRGVLDSKIGAVVSMKALVVIPDRIGLTDGDSRFLYQLRQRGITFSGVTEFYEYATRRVYLSSLTELWFLENVKYRDQLFYSFVKRIIDIIVALIGLGLLAILYIPIVGLIKSTSSGPVFFTHPRVGLYGTIFTVYKFRTMAVEDNPGNNWTAAGDSRITSFGRFLRPTRLDELPQVINLLRGEMSLVGPRPEQPAIVERLRSDIPFYDERHIVKPGLTGWGQLNVYARTVDDSKLKLQYDLYYIKHRSILFDFEIILKTVYHVLTSRDV